MRHGSLALPAFVCVALAGCRTAPKQEFVPQFGAERAIASGEPQYRFGVQPIRPTRRIWKPDEVLVRNQLNASSNGFKLRLVSAQTDETYNRKLRERRRFRDRRTESRVGGGAARIHHHRAGRQRRPNRRCCRDPPRLGDYPHRRFEGKDHRILPTRFARRNYAGPVVPSQCRIARRSIDY